MANFLTILIIALFFRQVMFNYRRIDLMLSRLEKSETGVSRGIYFIRSLDNYKHYITQCLDCLMDFFFKDTNEIASQYSVSP